MLFAVPLEGPLTQEQYQERFFTAKGGEGYKAILHEIGHAIGLMHPHQGIRLPDHLDDVQYTVMSYNHDSVDDIGIFPTTPMPLDILAIQHIYGPNTEWENGNTSYTFKNEDPEFKTIWDAGGDTDVFIASNQHVAVTIDLQPGHFSSIGITSFGEPATENIAIAYLTWIEYAVGSPYNDTILGNSLDNDLRGDDGDDTIHGGSGSDTLWGREGDDVLYASGDAVSWLDQMFLGGFDFIYKDYLFGGTGEDRLHGWKGNDILDGGEHNDTVWGHSGNDSMYGGGGSDSLWGEAGDDYLSGGYGRDNLFGGSGRDTLFGGREKDTLTGGDDADTFRFAKGDSSFGLTNADVITDFRPNLGDKIDLSPTDVSRFAGQSEWPAPGEVTYWWTDGNTVVSLNDGGQIEDIVISGWELTMVESDFLL